jgi:PAS domain S-box-containing protein
LRISYINHLRGGVTLEQAIGQPVRGFIAPEDYEAFENAVNRALLTGKTCSYIAKGSRSVTRRGAAYYESHAVPIDNGDGRRAVCIIATDVSEHFARAAALVESEEKLRIAVEATGIGLLTFDAVTDRLEWNERLVEMTGWTPSSAGEYFARVVHPEDCARVAGALDRARSGDPPFLEHRIVRPDGEVRWMLPFGSATKDEDGRLLRITGGVLDVTARRMTDEHLRKAQKLDAVGSLSAGIAHNLNNMLAVILPALERATRGPAPTQADMLQDALHAARRTAELVAQLMTFAGHGQSSSVAPRDLGPIVERVVSMCQHTFERQARIESSLAANIAKVTCDATAIEQVVVNLLINARDATVEAQREDPCIRVELSEVETKSPEGLTGRYARIVVKDNGIGMTDMVKQRLFEPFFTTKEIGRGTGLGLATSYGVVRDHGGFITIESQPGMGTTAAVFLPLAHGPTA